MTDAMRMTGRDVSRTKSRGHAIWSRFWPMTLIYSAVIIAVILAMTLPGAKDYVGIDNDDGMRLVEVRDFLNGQGWFDLTQYRLGLAGGTLMHWSRLIDLPIAGLIALFGHVFARETAEAIALTIWPPFLVLPLMVAMGLLGRRIAGVTGMHMVLGLTALLMATNYRFTPGAIDHHNVQQGLAAIMAAMLVDRRYQAWSFAVAGFAAALAIAIGAETTPLVAVVCLIVAVLWAWEGPAFAAAARAFGVALALSISAFFFLTVPPQHYSMVTCDNLSLSFYSLATIGGCLLAVMGTFLSGLERRIRFGLVALMGATVFASAAIIAPQCLGDPLGNLDPMLVELWLRGVTEAESVVKLSHEDVGSVGAFYATGLLAIIVCLVRIHRRDRVQVHAILLALVLTSWAIALVQVRGASFSNLLAIPPLALLLIDLRGIANKDPEDMGAAFFYIVTAFISVPAVWAVGGALAAGEMEDALQKASSPLQAEAAECSTRQALAPLATLPAGLVAAPSNLGVPILRYTQNRVLSAPYHRNQQGMLTELHIGLARPAEAEAFLRGANVSVIAFCKNDPQTRRLAKMKPDGLYAQLGQGNIPAFLTPLPDDRTSGVRFYRVTP